MIEGGMSPDEVGAIAVRGIQRNDAFIFPDSTMRSALEARFGRILGAMTPARD
jgi:hypothetical protein